jgi:hypothetical protein
MGYNAASNLVFGVALTEEQESSLPEEASEDYYPARRGPKVGLLYSGDARVEMHSPVLGIVIAGGYDWEPEEVQVRSPTEEELILFHLIGEELNIDVSQPKWYLVSTYG